MPAVTAPAGPAVPDLSPTACAAALAERFPALFGTVRAMPIKLRIQADIQTRAPGVFSKKSLSIFLHRHTTSTAYLRALVNTPTRHDLDGAVAGEVAEEHRLAATAEVERRRAIVDARRQAERDAQRQAHAAERNAARDGERRAHNEARAVAQAAERAQRAAAAAAAPSAPNEPSMPSMPSAPAAPDASSAAPEAGAVAAARPAPPPRPHLSPAEMEARRERAALLRAFETSTITRANFCVLKRISDSDLEDQLALAWNERELRAQEPRPEPRHDQRPDARPGGRNDQRNDQRNDSRNDRGSARHDRGPRPAQGDGRRGDPRAGPGAGPGGPSGPSGTSGPGAPSGPTGPGGNQRGPRPPQGKPPLKPTR